MRVRRSGAIACDQPVTESGKDGLEKRMIISRSRLALAVTLGVLALGMVASPATAQEELLFNNCEDRMFRDASIVGYSCRGISDLGTFENECVCFAQKTAPGAESPDADFVQFLLTDPGCTTAESDGLAFENDCSCQAVGAHLRKSSRYLCTGNTVFVSAESSSAGHVTFGGTNSGRVTKSGRYIWPGNGLSEFTQPPPASVFGCVQDVSCQQLCAACPSAGER